MTAVKTRKLKKKNRKKWEKIEGVMRWGIGDVRMDGEEKKKVLL